MPHRIAPQPDRAPRMSAGSSPHCCSRPRETPALSTQTPPAQPSDPPIANHEDRKNTKKREEWDGVNARRTASISSHIHPLLCPTSCSSCLRGSNSLNSVAIFLRVGKQERSIHSAHVLTT